jgi:hypothetical protein
MTKPNVMALPMNDANLRRVIAETAEDSARVRLTKHAKARMRERGVTLVQVLKVLRDGSVVESAHQDIHGNWKCVLEKVVAGDRVRVAAAYVQEGTAVVVVITVMN